MIWTTDSMKYFLYSISSTHNFLLVTELLIFFLVVSLFIYLIKIKTITSKSTFSNLTIWYLNLWAYLWIHLLLWMLVLRTTLQYLYLTHTSTTNPLWKLYIRQLMSQAQRLNCSLLDIVSIKLWISITSQKSLLSQIQFTQPKRSSTYLYIHINLVHLLFSLNFIYSSHIIKRIQSNFRSALVITTGFSIKLLIEKWNLLTPYCYSHPNYLGTLARKSKY